MTISHVSRPNILPAVIVLNAKYLPNSFDDPAQVGASSFTLSVLKVFHDLRALGGLVLYARDESLTMPRVVPHISYHKQVAFSCFTIYFNFRIPHSAVCSAFTTAFEQLGFPPSRGRLPIIYYQTDTLLHFHPPEYAYAVTHHGPFVADFSRHFSAQEAALAFGSAEKANVLAHQQELGIRALIQSSNGFALVHSSLQRQFLLDSGVPHDRCCLDLSPPIAVPHISSFPFTIPVEEFLQVAATCQLLLFTAVARLDHFKNIPVILSTAITLFKQGIDVRVLIAGDSPEDSSRRDNLMALVPSYFASRVLIIPTLSKPMLYSLFCRMRENAIFLFSSRYETLGITPLEAAVSGVATLVPESSLVEASVWFPPQYRVPIDSKIIADRIMNMLQDKKPGYHGSLIKEWVSGKTSEDRFRECIVRAWTKISEQISNRRVARPGETPLYWQP